MLTAVVLHPPRFDAKAASVDDRAALAEPGVKAVVPIDEGVAVVAEAFADAQRGLLVLNVEWDDEYAERRSSEDLLHEHRRLVASGEQAVVARADGNVDDGLNPDLVRAQVEGGLRWGLGAAAWGEVVLGPRGNIVAQNFDRYPVMQMQSTPRIEIHLIESTESPSGVGEVSVPTIAPALANAIFALNTGTRIRRLPMSRAIQIA